MADCRGIYMIFPLIEITELNSASVFGIAEIATVFIGPGYDSGRGFSEY